ncbi:MAG: prepilin-type N-terminal cleavage/methylation domain-containing protein [Thermomonas sp.]|uniref:prepilin-type N-terminal cleavage/methylation domain-containing protein n=1 Tax=Thermomonas sp. TaxID=1971895 RepID=UPI001ED3DD59|nr:prepilin-type N-terminal cleavage/methylation domain-containing protein [Thermomonas sp.]MBV2209738.1 prepilin-type N-terminal cleavage/methylation domain-containing protein [Thermomonas sp.]
MRRARGFSLLEVLLATSLLAAALLLVFGVLRAAGATVARGETLSQHNEQMRSVSALLRARLHSTQGIVFGFDQQTGRSLRFVGDATSMRFVAELPDYFGRGGPYLQTFHIKKQSNAVVLEVGFQALSGGQVLPAAVPTEALLINAKAVQLEYRGLGENGQLTPWQAQWPFPEALPLQVRVRIQDKKEVWPQVLVTLPLAGNYVNAMQRTP